MDGITAKDASIYQLSRWSQWEAVHCLKVATIAAAFARSLQKDGFPVTDKDVSNVYLAGILHDWGKLLSMDRSLNRKGKESMSLEDWEQIQRHPSVGSDQALHFKVDEAIAHLIAHHHCRLPHKTESGRTECGYPFAECNNLEFTPLLWCLILADCYDALTGDREYSVPVPPDVALTIMRNDVGRGILDKQMMSLFCCFIAQHQHHS